MREETAFWTLDKAVAWVAWRNADRPLLPAVSENPSVAELHAWIDQRNVSDAQTQHACHELARAAATIEMWGVRPTQGYEPRTFRGGEHEEISALLRTMPCTIPFEWLMTAKVVQFESGAKTPDGSPKHITYTAVYVRCARMRSLWPPIRSKPAKLALRWLTEHQQSFPGTKYSEAIAACVLQGFGRGVCRQVWKQVDPVLKLRGGNLASKP